jgi:hypothetical protein
MTFDPERNDQLRDGLERAGLEAVLAWHTEEVVLATGACSHLGLTVCLYPLRGEPWSTPSRRNRPAPCPITCSSGATS